MPAHPIFPLLKNTAYEPAYFQQAILATAPPCHLPLSIFPLPEKRKNLATFIYIFCLSFCYIFWVLHLHLALNSILKVFFFSPALTRIGNILRRSVLKNLKEPEMTKSKHTYTYAHRQLLCKVYYECRICPNSEKLTSNPPPHSHIL